MRGFFITIVAFAAITLLAVAASADFVAYNDCSGSSSGNVTSYNAGSSGLLKDYTTGAWTNVTITVTANIGSNDPNLGGMPNAGTDAYNVFNGKINMVGMYWCTENTTDQYVTVTFTGLDPTKRYEFVTTADRASSSYTDRSSKFTIAGVDSCINASTTGTIIGAGGLSTSFCTGYNTVTGYVARWIDIAPGADGSFSVTGVRADYAPVSKKAYFFAGVMLTETTIPEPSSLLAMGSGLLGIAGFAVRRRRNR